MARDVDVHLYEPDTFVPLARLEQTLEEPAHISLGPDGEFIEHPPRAKHATYFYQNDHLGIPQELVDEEGEIVWLGKYRAWGELRGASQKNGQPAKIRNALRFQGQYCDHETGLHYSLNRYYDPAAGRFINEDPIELEGGINLFEYAPNPVQWVDPLGLSACPTRSEVIAKTVAIVKMHQSAIYALDPSARVGIRGSLASGQRGSGGPWDPTKLDIDAYVASDKLYDWNNRYASGIPGLGAIEKSVNRALHVAVPCLKRNAFSFKTQKQYFPDTAPGFEKIIPIF